MIRVCENDHLIVSKVCGICGLKASLDLGGRMVPILLHPKSKGKVKLRALKNHGKRGSVAGRSAAI